ncbi:MAG: hypothetical protein KF852_10755 [Saprospiraceae bacterium]|nr:hypothetical protein [Saprospiraceae bacterium]
MTEGNRTDDLVKDFERVVKKAIDANTVYYREAAAALQDLYSGKTELSGTGVMNTLSEALTSLVKLQLQYAENLYDLQLHWSKNMTPKAAPASQREAVADSQRASAAYQPAAARKMMTVTGTPGKMAALLLHFNSRDETPRHCRFTDSGFYDAATGSEAPLRLIYEPESFALISGQAVEVRLSVMIPDTAPLGAYRNTVTVLGYDDSVFDLIAVVQAAQEDEAPIPPVKAGSTAKPATKPAATKTTKPPVSKAAAVTTKPAAKPATAKTKQPPKKS